MSIFRHIVGIAAELFTLDDPYTKGERVTPAVTGTRYDMTANISGRRANRKCYNVVEVRANDYQEAAKFAEGITVEGDVSKSIVHVGRNKWEIRVEEWDTEVRR